MNIGVVRVTLRGMAGSRLVVHAFAEKARAEIRDKQQKRGRQARQARDTEAEYRAARYVDDKGRECVPVTALKRAIVSAARSHDGFKMTELRQALFVRPAGDASELVPIETHDGSPAIGVMREDAVTLQGATRGLTYRPEYPHWQVRVLIEHNLAVISAEQIAELLRIAGWGVGICEGRPEKSSALGWGRFETVALE